MTRKRRENYHNKNEPIHILRLVNSTSYNKARRSFGEIRLSKDFLLWSIVLILEPQALALYFLIKYLAIASRIEDIEIYDLQLKLIYKMIQKDTAKLSELQNDPLLNVEVTLIQNGSTKQIQWNRQIPLLDALLNAGVQAPHSCCRGNCGTCVCKIEEGEVRLKRNFILSEAHIKRGLILTCVSIPVSDHIRINFDTF